MIAQYPGNAITLLTLSITGCGWSFPRAAEAASSGGEQEAEAGEGGAPRPGGLSTGWGYYAENETEEKDI